jgi:TPR repeat protein
VIAAPLTDAGNPAAAKPPDPFKQPAIPLPPTPSPKNPIAPKGPPDATAEKLGPRDRPLDEDDVYAAYQRGLFVEAFAFATDLAAKGVPQAMTMLGELYHTGQGIKPDPKRAFEWYRLGADRGDREAEFALGLMYLNGTGVTADLARARALFEASAKQDQPTALFNLAMLAIDGRGGRPDIGRARDLLHRSAQLGNAEAAYAYAQMLEADNGPSNDKDVTNWLGLAANAGHVAAEVEYGIRLAKGIGTKPDIDMAVLYLNRAAWAGNAVAQNRIAHLIATGTGLPFNDVEAVKWHLIAKAGGVQDPRLEDLMATLKPDDLARARTLAVNWPPAPAALPPAHFQPTGSDTASFDLRGPLDVLLPSSGKDSPTTPVR